MAFDVSGLMVRCLEVDLRPFIEVCRWIGSACMLVMRDVYVVWCAVLWVGGCYVSVMNLGCDSTW